jgi:bacterial leucyl aminopeptidase
MIKTFKLIFSLFTSTLALSAQASPELTHQQLQVPNCLANQIAIPHTVVAENKRFKIIDVTLSQVDDVRMLADKVRCGRFINVTSAFSQKPAAAKQGLAKILLNKPVMPAFRTTHTDYPISQAELVNQAIDQVSEDNIVHTLTHLTSYTNRSPHQENGPKTAIWLKNKFEDMAQQSGRSDTASYFVHTGKGYIQPSLVTVIGKDLNKPGIVIGAHMDTLGKTKYQRMPGAGDDGSGSASIMEVARILLSSNLVFDKPVYIIWYAAEEYGLVGSKQVVKHFVDNEIPVDAVIQFDMTGFRNDPDDKTMWVFQDHTDPSLSNFMEQLITTYVKVPVNYSKCGYGCSDHASWMAEGIPAAFPCETSFEDHNDKIHSAEDTMDRLTPEHMANFSKLGLAFAIELASHH